jgi:hypothetical protein
MREELEEQYMLLDPYNIEEVLKCLESVLTEEEYFLTTLGLSKDGITFFMRHPDNNHHFIDIVTLEPEFFVQFYWDLSEGSRGEYALKEVFTEMKRQFEEAVEEYRNDVENYGGKPAIHRSEREGKRNLGCYAQRHV